MPVVNTLHVKPCETPILRSCPEAQEIRRLFNAALGAPSDSTTNMAPNPVAFERKHSSMVVDSDYVVLEKTDGARYCLFMGEIGGQGSTDPPKERFNVLVDRNFDLYEIFMHAPDSVYQGLGTLMDGELVAEKDHGVSGHIYLVFDAMVVEGQQCLDEPYSERMARAKKIVRPYEADDSEPHRFTMSAEEWEAYASHTSMQKNLVMTSGASPCALDVRYKPFYKSNFVGTVLRKMSRGLKHQTDGVILMPNSQPVRLKTHHSLFKWKQVHTADFYFTVENVKTPTSCTWVWTPHYLVKDKGHVSTPISVDGKVYSLQMLESKMRSSAERRLDKSGFDKREFVAECEIAVDEGVTCLMKQGASNTFSKNTVSIKVVRLRPDKTSANSDYTVSRTIVNVKENISSQELCQVLKSDFYK